MSLVTQMNLMRAKVWIWLVILLLCHIGNSDAQALKIAKSFQQPQVWGIHVIDLQTGKIRFIVDLEDWQMSPDGQHIVGGKMLRNTNDYGVFVVLVRGGKPRQLAKVPVRAPYHPSYVWSPDSRRVTIKGDRKDDGKDETFTVSIRRPATAKSTQHRANKPVQLRLPKSAYQMLKKRFDTISGVAYSPDGKWIAAELSKGFYQDSNYRGGIFIFHPDGSNLMQITKNVPFGKKDADDREIVWLSDGKHLLFRRTSYEDEGI
jgi:Tol biopolymer transport system component